MVYRFESDADAFPNPGSDLLAPGTLRSAPTGPSRSRFPAPSLQRPTRPALPSATVHPAGDNSSPTRDTVPVPQPSGPVGVPPAEPYRSGHGPGRLWQVLVGSAAVLVLLAICGLGTAALLTDYNPLPQSAPTPAPSTEPSSDPVPQGLDSRESDPRPLTAKEVFPTKKLALGDAEPAYQVLKAQSSGSCAVAATDDVADLLVRLGCNQVVRATLRSPDQEHLATTGLFNLTDRASAERARDQIRQILDEQQGRFRGMAAGDGTEAVTRAAARVAWQVRGHYLAYCLVTRVDGEPIRASDPETKEILFDLIQLHLIRGVLVDRTTAGSAGQPSDTE